jgi:isopenicillin-N N-acyltransferase-like protein
LRKKKLVWLGVLGFLILLPLIFVKLTIYSPPTLPQPLGGEEVRTQLDSTTFRYKNNWLRKNEYGNWESYIEGDAYERGMALSILHGELIQNQEKVFVSEIEKLLPSRAFRTVLQLGIGWFNRNLDQVVPEEFLQEIYLASRSLSDEFDFVGPKYNRILNYHAAHDIGHMVQNMNLVACTAVGRWDFDSEEAKMILGRNFDFYFGDDFAKDKIVLFVNPAEGYDFVSVTWGGFSGVVSGMNEAGLTVTLNSLPSELPGKSSTPVSLIAREIVQYASTIQEAMDIASRYETFVSESFTIASAKDRSMAVIEKTPQHTAIFHPEGNNLIVANHFQSDYFKDRKLNLEHIERSDSKPRYDRMLELIQADSTLGVSHTLQYLREQNGLGGQKLGMGNPMAINQLLAHHAVIFEPIRGLAYISTWPYQENIFNAYDVRSISSLGNHDLSRSAEIDSLRLDVDPFYVSSSFSDFENYKAMRQAFSEEPSLADGAEFADQWIATNPDYYESYLLLADHYLQAKDYAKAHVFYLKASAKAIPYADIRERINEGIKKSDERNRD